MATVEKRRPTVIPPAGFTDSGRPSVSQAAGATESEEDFLRQVGVTDMLRAALLKVLEARPEEPIAFLAHYFENMGLRSPVNGGTGEPPGQLLLQQQRLGRALWHLRLAHHSQRKGGLEGAGLGPALDSALPAARALLAGFAFCDDFLQLLRPISLRFWMGVFGGPQSPQGHRARVVLVALGPPGLPRDTASGDRRRQVCSAGRHLVLCPRLLPSSQQAAPASPTCLDHQEPPEVTWPVRRRSPELCSFVPTHSSVWPRQRQRG
ncbi:hypothetical protein P7K49_032675 [Saguinus oedipus]|uniref:Tubulin polyglutamylase complex subunit 1 n=1 Tax=Saguinus oedipus TaxID=9490 RepID=A0ABQ9TQU1_SAGOE|nr:hypothetical protein P7K49_032675 [Saguinus oedipus]